MVELAYNLPKDYAIVYNKSGEELVKVTGVVKVMIGDQYTTITYKSDDSEENSRLTTNLPFIYNE